MEWGLHGTKPAIPLASCGAWRWRQGGAPRQKSSRSSTCEVCEPCTFLQQTLPLLNYTQLFCKKQLLRFGRGVVVSVHPPMKEHRMSNHSMDNQNATSREWTGIPRVIPRHPVSSHSLVYPPSMNLLHSLILEAAQPLCLCHTNYVGNLEAFYKGKYSCHASDIWCICVCFRQFQLLRA